ncbi:hypothetical protein KFX89_24710 [Bacteroides thetaiotaomicron]|uniref:hypothetical protein n=1 Tax=Bacteroides thetaiotaomicron TaxID=818 RepID=UPI001CE3AA12|nr:hypothetical protein [Bacteroides thetaiotaomicron]MCA6029929.1 hypothetical protein [Bacteroides thetaiotaomicron]
MYLKYEPYREYLPEGIPDTRIVALRRSLSRATSPRHLPRSTTTSERPSRWAARWWKRPRVAGSELRLPIGRRLHRPAYSAVRGQPPHHRGLGPGYERSEYRNQTD